MSVYRARTPKPNVYLVQPHPFAVRELFQKLSDRYRIFVIQDSKAISKCEVSNTSELLFIFDKATITLPISFCMESLRRLSPEPKAILLAHASTPEEQFHLLSLGLKGIILYKDALGQLQDAVLSVSSGGYWLTREVLDQYVLRRSTKGGLRVGCGLTEREAEVLQLLKQRFSNKEIGLKLLLSESTVKFHVANIFTKLGVHDRLSVLDLLELENHGNGALRQPAPGNASVIMLQRHELRGAPDFPIEVRNEMG